MELDITEQTLNLLPPADWAGEFARLKEDIQIERDRNLRTLADFKNFRRRIEREGNRSSDEAKREMILPLLEIVDDLEKALQWGKDDEHASYKGLRMIHQKFMGILGTIGAVPFVSLGMAFDHTIHDAVALDQHPGGTSGVVVDELRKGYFWKNELLRTAQVRVSGF
ncbi:MAG: nucleotide exchange factor GrpE [Bacteroidetes bacterium]|nr:nucleotide exchange factor GrpE [Bacteroidota bacterium]